MLYPTVRIDKPGPHGPDLRPLCMPEHRLQPLTGDYLGVVVEEEYVLCLGMGGGKVVDSRVVERFPERYDPVRYRGQVFQCLLIFAVVVDDEQLVIRVGRQPLDTFYATLQEGGVVPRRDNDTYFGLAFDLQLGSEMAGEMPVFHGTFEPPSLQSLGESSASSLSYVALIAVRRRKEMRRHPSMVQNLRDLVDLVSSLGGAQNQIVILTTFETLPEPTNLF